MSLVPWRNKGKQHGDNYEIEPYDTFDRFRSEMDRVFDRFMGGLSTFDDGGFMKNWAPSLDVSETNTDITVRAELPGIDPKDLEITVSGNVLTLSGEKKESSERKGENFFHSERRFGSFRRSVTLPSAVDAENVSAEHKNGIVNITFKKRESAIPRRITVQAGK